MRSIKRSWQNKPHGWTHRIKWYEGPYDIRLYFENEDGTRSEYFNLEQREEATQFFNRFKINPADVEFKIGIPKEVV